jgi:hypothetical protein
MRSRFLENLAYLVPGYEGYKGKDRRREEDSRFRGLLLHRLTAIRGRMGDLLAKLSAGPHEAKTDAVEARAKTLDSLADAIRYAPYGFSGFFDAAEVCEGTLDRILEVDLLLFEDLDTVEQIVTRTESGSMSRSAVQTFLDELDEATRRFEHHLIQRDKALGDA